MVNVAKNAIRSELYAVPLKLNPIPPKLKEKRACFVTLTRIGQLRGCIGHILPVQELYKDIIENSKAAAFEDPRFSPVTEKELADLTIEISVLTIPKPFSYHTHEELLHYLGKRKPGVILSKGSAQATFLPAVWDDIHDPQVFLTHLSLKAGLGSDEWKHGVTIQCYRAEKITA
jgi:AmmeMemoRadiSam system protein A